MGENQTEDNMQQVMTRKMRVCKGNCLHIQMAADAVCTLLGTHGMQSSPVRDHKSSLGKLTRKRAVNNNERTELRKRVKMHASNVLRRGIFLASCPLLTDYETRRQELTWADWLKCTLAKV